ETGIPYSIRDKCLVGRVRSTLAFVVKADQQIGANAHQLPTQEHLKEVVGEDQIEHRETEQRQKQKESAKAAPALEVPVLRVNLVVRYDRLQLLRHVTNGKQVDEGGNQRHHQKHDNAKAIDIEAELELRAR